jgi:1-hydroxycarotenoid 3,4-desaturase
MADDRVVIVGAGVGGLSAAIALAARGVAVTIVERAERPGGKMREVAVGEAHIDAGPTVLTMRWVFDELLADVGSSVAEALPPLTPLPVLARHAWARDGSRLDLFADRARSAEAIAAFAGPEDGRAYLAFCERAARVYGQLERPHIRSGKPGVLQMIRDLGPRGLATLAALGPLASLASALQREFRDERLRQLVLTHHPLARQK